MAKLLPNAGFKVRSSFQYTIIKNISNPCARVREISRCIDVFYRIVNDSNLYQKPHRNKLIQEVKSIALENTKINISQEDLVCYGPNSLASFISYFHNKYDGLLDLKKISIDFDENTVETCWLGNEKIGNHKFKFNDYGDRITYLEF